MSEILIYSKDNCHYCTQAKILLQSKKIDFREVIIGKDITREEFLEEYPSVRSVPYIIIDGKAIGGFEELQQIKFEDEKEM